MATLVLDSADVEVRASGDVLALYRDGVRTGTVPLALLDRVIMQGDVRMSAGVLTRLAESGVATPLLSRRHARRVAIVLGVGHNDAAIRIGQVLLGQDERWLRHWSSMVVRHKVRGQRRVLEFALTQRPDARKPLVAATRRLATAEADLRATPAEVEQLRGVEGAAARTYFAALAAVMPPAMGFVGRTRRPPRDPVNACLSLAYTLLHFEAVRACHAAGLDPLVGFYHRPSFGRESLASDLIEPWRPQVDLWVWNQVRSRDIRPEHFGRDGEAVLLGKAARGAFYARFEVFMRPLRRRLRRQCAALVRNVRARGEGALVEADEGEE